MPAPYGTIACFVDGGPASRVAFEEAAALRALAPGELKVVHVLAEPAMLLSTPFAGPPPTIYDERGAAGEWLAAQIGETPNAEAVLLRGYPPRAACNYAASAGIDLIVAAAHRGIVDRAMLGGFASYVAYHAPCPVLLVHPPTPSDAAEGAAGPA
jgi:nucleotide-binding universal stress UspA family protein